MSDIPANESADQLLEVEEITTEPMGASDGEAITVKPDDTGSVPLQDFLGISNPDEGQKDKLDFIWGYFAKGRDRADTLRAIKEAKSRLSQPEVGETHLHKLYAYTRLLEDARSIEKEKKVYENDASTGPVDRTR